MGFREVESILKKQKPTGLWSSNMLGIGADPELGVRATGTIAQYRRLTELGVPSDHRAITLSNRVFYRLLSRDPDPGLLFEYRKPTKADPDAFATARRGLKSAVTTALVCAGFTEDPRVRGAAKDVIEGCAEFIRSDLAEDPFVKSGSRRVLHPEARPPTVFVVSMAAHLPMLLRERAGFIDQLAEYFRRPPPKGAWTLKLGDAFLAPRYQLLGDPLGTTATGRQKDIPFALYWIESLARLGVLQKSPSAIAALSVLLENCDDKGIWSPRNLKNIPSSSSGLVDFAFPLHAPIKKPEDLRVDVTFRLALIAKLSNWDLSFS